MLELVAERIRIVVQGSEHTAAEEQDSGPDMGPAAPETFPAWPKS